MLHLGIPNMVPSAGAASSGTEALCACAATDTAFLSSPVAGTCSCTMKFTVRDCDPDTGVPAEEGYDDEYVVSLPCTETAATPAHR